MKKAATIPLCLWGSVASACPLCHTSTAGEVRAGILATAQDGSVLLALAGPFLALGLIVGLLHRKGDPS